MSSNASLAQRVAPLIGAFYVVIGIIGFFVTGFGKFVQDTPDKLLGFAINPFHNLVHLGIGLFLILMTTQFSTAVAEGAVMGVGVFYIAATLIGVLPPATNLSIISMHGSGDLENLNHAVNGIFLLGLGLASTTQSEAKAKRTGIPA